MQKKITPNIRKVDARIALLLNRFKGQTTNRFQVITAGGRTAEQDFPKAIAVDELAATFYRKGGQVNFEDTHPDGFGISWMWQDATYRPLKAK